MLEYYYVGLSILYGTTIQEYIHILSDINQYILHFLSVCHFWV